MNWLKKINWTPVRRWSLAYWCSLVVLALLEEVTGWHIGLAVACYLLAEKYDPRAWWGQMEEDLYCSTCRIGIRTKAPKILEIFRALHTHPDASE